SPGERFSAKIVLDGSRLLRLDWNNTGSDNTFTRRWMHPDHLGTASLISNDAGDKESFGSQHFSCGKSLPPGERFSAKIVLDESITIYLPYGAVPSASLRESTLEEKSETGFRDPYGFTGKELEVDLGIMYFGARWYNPQLGRWLSPDPLYLVSTAKNAERQQNLYEYASNNPWTFVDPNGLDETADQYKKTVNDVRGKNNPDIAGSKDRLDGKNSESRLKELHDSINHGKKFLGVGNVSFIISTAWSMAIGIIESDVTSNKFTKNGNTFAVGYLQMSRYELLKAMNTNHDFKKYVNDWLAKNPKPNKRPSHFRPIKGNTPEISAQNDALWKNVTKEEWALTNGKINILAFMINVNNNLRQVINNSCSGRFCFSDRKNLNLNSPFMSILKLATSGNIKGLQMILSLMHNSTGYWQLQFSRRSSFLSNPQGFVNIINNYEGPDKKASFRNAKKVFTYVRQISILISIIEKNIK
ncbi:RHS repeat-associated core domain-containing protein, partial [Myxococcota bacterium]|nr:RHS repeat-associated core domain-containing protein [Myxococcota bacterium]